MTCIACYCKQTITVRVYVQLQLCIETTQLVVAENDSIKEKFARFFEIPQKADYAILR